MSYKKEQCQNYINRIEGFLLDTYEVEIVYGHDLSDAYYVSARCVEINNRQNYPSRLHSLLHEAGHVILRNQEGATFSSAFPYLRLGGTSIRGDKYHRSDVIREEVLAWEKAKELSCQLGIQLDSNLWNKHRQNALLTYMEWF